VLRPAGSTRAWSKLRAYVLARDADTCQRVVDATTGARCGAPAATVGHIISRVEWPRDPDTGAPRPGVDDLANLQAECRRCNYGDGARWLNARRAGLGASRDW
jgi:5-methylcytosine-specific restriction endonuclease McrA